MTDAEKNDAGQSDAGKLDVESLSFEESLKRLEEIVSLLEGGKADLSVSLARYEEGVRLLRHCRVALDDAQRRIETLKKLGDSGPIETEPVDFDALQSDAATPGRGTVRQKKSAARAKKSTASEGKAGPSDVENPGEAEKDVSGQFFDFGDQ